jgi:excisionase family DNA binding protein
MTTLLTTEEAAAYVGITRAGIHMATASGRLRYVQSDVGKRRKFFTEADLNRYLMLRRFKMFSRGIQPASAAEMKAAGWQLDYRRDRRGRLYGALPLGVAAHDNMTF